MDNILECFVKEPEKEFHVREIANIVGKAPTTVSKYLKEYSKKGILKFEGKHNHLFFRANSENGVFRRIKKSYNLDKLYSSGLIAYLEEELNIPEAIILFGSYARGENGKNSDIDLVIITPTKKELNLSKFEKVLGGEIQVLKFARKELEVMKEKNKELLNNIINGIVLEGYFEVFK